MLGKGWSATYQKLTYPAPNGWAVDIHFDGKLVVHKFIQGEFAMREFVKSYMDRNGG